jgi:hypothetical protein
LIGRERLFALVSAVIRGLAKRKKPRRLRGHKDSLRQNGAASRAQSLILPPRGYVSRRKARMPSSLQPRDERYNVGENSVLVALGALGGGWRKEKNTFLEGTAPKIQGANQMPQTAIEHKNMSKHGFSLLAS